LALSGITLVFSSGQCSFGSDAGSCIPIRHQWKCCIAEGFAFLPKLLTDAIYSQAQNEGIMALAVTDVIYVYYN